jgi:hypothetical protein
MIESGGKVSAPLSYFYYTAELQKVIMRTFVLILTRKTGFGKCGVRHGFAGKIRSFGVFYFIMKIVVDDIEKRNEDDKKVSFCDTVCDVVVWGGGGRAGVDGGILAVFVGQCDALLCAD